MTAPDEAAGVEAFVKAFTGSNRFVLDYLLEEVLATQPEHVRDFLLDTSVLEQLSGPLCDALTGGTDGEELLETLERENLFLSPLDDQRGGFRYHPLFADALRARLRGAHPARVASLHRASVRRRVGTPLTPRRPLPGSGLCCGAFPPTFPRNGCLPVPLVPMSRESPQARMVL